MCDADEVQWEEKEKEKKEEEGRRTSPGQRGQLSLFLPSSPLSQTNKRTHDDSSNSLIIPPPGSLPQTPSYHLPFSFSHSLPTLLGGLLALPLPLPLHRRWNSHHLHLTRGSVPPCESGLRKRLSPRGGETREEGRGDDLDLILVFLDDGGGSQMRRRCEERSCGRYVGRKRQIERRGLARRRCRGRGSLPSGRQLRQSRSPHSLQHLPRPLPRLPPRSRTHRS